MFLQRRACEVYTFRSQIVRCVFERYGIVLLGQSWRCCRRGSLDGDRSEIACWRFEVIRKMFLVFGDDFLGVFIRHGFDSLLRLNDISHGDAAKFGAYGCSFNVQSLTYSLPCPLAQPIENKATLSA